MRLLKGHRHNKPVRSLVFSPDSTKLASCARDYITRLWDLATANSSIVSGDSWGAHSAVFSPDGSTVLTRKYSGLALWDIASGSSRTIETDYTGNPVEAAYSPDGRLVASTGRTVELWSTATWEPLARWPGNGQATGCLAFTPDGRALATGHMVDREYGIKLWDVQQGKERAVLRGPTGMPTALAFSPDGRLLAAACGQSLWVWDAGTGETSVTHRIDLQHYKDVAFTPDGRFLAVARNDQTVRLLDTRTWAESAAFDWEIGPIVTLAIAPDGMRAAAGGSKGKIVVWDLD
jgi:WD40 repeat protein